MNQSPTPLTPAARTLVRESSRGVLSTLLIDDGTPYASLVEFMPLENGDIVMFLSQLAEHQRYLAADPRASIFIAPELNVADALARPRVTLVGEVARVERQPYRDAYLACHPGAKQYIDFGDFNFYRLFVAKVRYIAGFGRMGWIPGDRYHVGK